MRGAHPRVVLGLHRSRHGRRLLTGALDLGVTSIDTSTNYLGFRSHTVLARTVGDLLPRLRVSTKVGYFPGPERTEHSLDPVRLYEAVEQAARDLGREPDLVFLHNPEHSLRDIGDHGREAFTQGCAALENAAAKGLCGIWGVSSWDPSPLVGLIDPTTPRPSVLMARTGLLVGVRTLDAVDALTAVWGLASGSVWGMSPFGGDTGDPVWDRVDPRMFLRNGGRFSRTQAAFRAAYCLPRRVSTLAVGTDEPAHLAELLVVLAAEIDEGTIREYRALLRQRSSGQPA
ncbi:aldo/keto reductase [Streptomyces sp. NPDC087897]|uniref:aldo/keto reductase n=1 Tax=Streptomyces sp. NPDC087897 TaxID=3365817 RepID=UPI0038137C23